MLMVCRVLVVAAAAYYYALAFSAAGVQAEAEAVVWQCTHAAQTLYRLRCLAPDESVPSRAQYPLFSAMEFQPVLEGLTRDTEPNLLAAVGKAAPCNGRTCGAVLDPRVLKYYPGPEVHASEAAEARAFVARFDVWLRSNSACDEGEPVLQRRERMASGDVKRVVYTRSCF